MSETSEREASSADQKPSSAPAEAKGEKPSVDKADTKGAAATPKKAPDIKLEVKNLSVTYRTPSGDDLEAVRDVSFTIKNKPDCGEVAVFLGPSGCGKSTILKSIAGLIAPSKGEIFVHEAPIDGVGRDRGMVFQAYTSFDWMTVLDNVAYGLRLQGQSKTEANRAAMKYVDAVGLTDSAKLYPKQLSGGMKQRVAIARTMLNKPNLLLMDEPFGALDPFTRWDMQGLLLDINEKEDNTILFVTHDVAEAVYIADVIFVLSSRPAQILHRIEVPAFKRRDHALKSSPEFRDIEKKVLDLLYAGR